MNKKFFYLLSVGLLSTGVLAACGSLDTEDVSTGGSNESAAKSEETKAVPAEENVKKFNAGIAHEAAGLKINIADVKIAEDAIHIGMNLENTGDSKVTFYPDQGNAIIGDMQLSANMFMGSGEVSGDINAGIKMDGVVTFSAPDGKKLDVQSIKEVKLDLGDVLNTTTFKSEPVSITVPVK